MFDPHSAPVKLPRVIAWFGSPTMSCMLRCIAIRGFNNTAMEVQVPLESGLVGNASFIEEALVTLGALPP